MGEKVLSSRGWIPAFRDPCFDNLDMRYSLLSVIPQERRRYTSEGL